MMSEDVERAPPNAAGNDDLDALLAQPAWERAGLVVRRRQHLGVQDGLGFWVHLDQGKLAAAAKVSVKVTVFVGDGNFHEW
jgi:hypothetical protein